MKKNKLMNIIGQKKIIIDTKPSRLIWCTISYTEENISSSFTRISHFKFSAFNGATTLSTENTKESILVRFGHFWLCSTYGNAASDVGYNLTLLLKIGTIAFPDLFYLSRHLPFHHTI